MRLSRLCGWAVAFAICSSPYSIFAQERSYAIEEVVVTAQKREQSIQDVPIAVSAFDNRFLDESGVDDVFELQFFVPGLTVQHNQSSSQTTFNIRGVGTAGNSLSLESSVGVYIDGVYRSRQTSAIGDLVDVERVEVLKGPQGTLFGKNTASGAVQYLTVAPALDEYEAYVELNAGDLSYQNLNGAVNFPLAEGKAALRFSGGFTKRDGYADNLATGTKLNERDRFAVRGQLLWLPSDTVEVRIIADLSELDEKCCSASNVFDGPGDTTAAFFDYVLGGGSLGAPDTNYVSSIEAAGGQLVLADRFGDFVTAMDFDPFADIKETGLSGEVNWDVGDLTFTSITAWRTYEAVNLVDADFTSLDSLFAGDDTEQEAITQEFRIASNSAGPFNWLAGAYYYKQDLDNFTTLRTGVDTNTMFTGGATLAQLDAAGAFAPAIPPGLICAGVVPDLLPLLPLCPLPAVPPDEGSNNISKQDQQSWAVFAQADFDLADNLVVTAGLRYTDESKDMDVLFLETLPTPVFGLLTDLSPFVPDATGIEIDEEKLTYTLKFSYFWTDEVMTYASYGTGFKSGGTNIDRIDPGSNVPQIFDPETSKSFEVGVKGDFFNSLLRINASIYRTDFEDFQANTFVGTGFVLQNAGEISTRGGEIEVFAAPTEWLSLFGGFSLVDAQFDSFQAGPCILTPLPGSPDDNASQPGFPIFCDKSGAVVPSTPEWMLFGSARVTHTFDNGWFGYGQLDINTRSDTEAGNDNDANKVLDGFTLMNLRVGVSFNDDQWDISLWGKNIFDEEYNGGVFNSVVRQGSLTGYHEEPSTWGLTVRAQL